MPSTTLTISLDQDLLDRLTATATERNTTADGLVASCVEQHLEVALRHRVLVERMETVDAQIEAIARFIEGASSGGGLDPVDLFKLCRYPRKA